MAVANPGAGVLEMGGCIPTPSPLVSIASSISLWPPFGIVQGLLLYYPVKGTGVYTIVAAAFSLRVGVLVVITLSVQKADSGASANTSW